MKVLRRLVKTVSSFLFVTSLSILLLVSTLIKFTEYKTLKPFVLDAIQESLTYGGIDWEQLHANLKLLCSQQETIEIPIEIIGKVTFSCSNLNATSPEATASLFSTIIFDEMYYHNYTCEFIECIQQGNYFAIISQYGNNFLKSVWYYILLVTVLFGTILFFSIELLPDRLKGLGIVMLSTSIPFVFSYILQSQISARLSYARLIAPFVREILFISIKYTLIVLIFGIALIVLGYVAQAKERRKERV